MSDFGPWFVALLFNEEYSSASKSKTTKKKTALVVHSYAHRAASIKNKLNEYDSWLTMQVIGPFSQRVHAECCRDLWDKNVRTKAGKLQRGVEIVEKYGKKYNVKMWAMAVERDEVFTAIQHKRKRDPAHYCPRFPLSMKAIERLGQKRAKR